MAPAAETSSIVSSAPSAALIPASIGVGFLAASIGYGGGILAGALAPSLLAWGGFAVAAIVVGGIGGTLASRRATAAGAELVSLRAEITRVPMLEQQIEARRAKLRQIRHDIRGALSPALLASDRLLSSSDPAIKRTAEIVVRSVDRAIILLAETSDATPPAGP